MSPYVHLFKTMVGKYLYDINTDCIIKLNNDEYEELKHYLHGGEETEYVSRLIRNGYLSNKRVMVSEHPATKRLECLYNTKLKYLVLQLTQNCNMRCKYCVYSGEYNMRSHSNKKMSWDIAKKSIDYFLNHSIDNQKIYIGFYGGEPLLEIELMKKCTKYVIEKVGGREIVFNLTTNGTLLDKEISDFLYKYNFFVTLSLDGPESVHDNSRKLVNNKGTYKIIYNNILNLSGRYPDYFKHNISVNAVVTTKNKLDDIDHFFNASIFKDLLVTTTFVTNEYRIEKIKYSDETVEEVKYMEFLEFLEIIGEIKYSSVLMEDRYSNMLTFRQPKQGFKYTRKNIPERYHHGGPCIPGVMKLFVNVYGNFYPCEKICEINDEYLIGNVYEGIDVDKGKNVLNIERQMENKCHDCWAYELCDICAMKFFESKSKDTIDESCAQTRFKADQLLKDYCVYKELMAKRGKRL